VLHLYADADTNLVEISTYPDSPGCSASWVGRPAEDVAGPYVYDSLYQAMLTLAADSSWTTPSGEDLKWQDTLMQDLRSIGVLDSLQLLYIFAGNGSQDWKRINWAGTIDDAERDRGQFFGTGVSDSLFTDGFAGNGTDIYFDTRGDFMTGYGGAGATRTNIMLGGWISRNEGSGTQYIWGETDTRYRPHNVIFVNSSPASGGGFIDPAESDNSATGFFIAARPNSSNNIEYFYNGTDSGPVALTVSNVASYQNPFVNAINGAGIPGNWGAHKVGVFIQGQPIRQKAELYAAIQKYMNHY